MRIAIDARIIASSTGRYVERLLHYLQELDHDNTYFVLLQDKDFREWKPTSPNFKRVRAPYPPYSFGEQLGLARLLRSLKPDLVHFTMPQQPLLYRGRRITTVHDLTLLRFRNPARSALGYTIKRSLFRIVLRRASRKSDTIIVPSMFVAQDVAANLGVPVNKLVVTPEAADPIADQPVAVKTLINKDFLLYVGNGAPHKNLRRLIDAFHKVKIKYPELQLVLVGKTNRYYEELADYVSGRSVSDVRFLGYQTDAQLRWLYEHALAYVFPSLSEGFGLPGLEAMQYGLPVLSSNATCLPEVYGDSALYFDPTSINDMAAAITKLISSRKLQRDLAKKGKARTKLYSWEKTAQATLEAYQSSAGS